MKNGVLCIYSVPMLKKKTKHDDKGKAEKSREKITW